PGGAGGPAGRAVPGNPRFRGPVQPAERGGDDLHRVSRLLQRFAAEAGERRGVAPADEAPLGAEAEENALTVGERRPAEGHRLGQRQAVRVEGEAVDAHGYGSSQPIPKTTQ